MTPRWLFFPSTGQSLVIHDAFGGSGALSGRTPDTVDNGNTWTTFSGQTYTVGSGYVSASNNTSDFSKVAELDANATTYEFRSEWTANSTASWSCGPCVAVTDGTNGSETFAKFDYVNGFRCVEYNNGSASVTSLSSTFTVSNPFVVVLEVSGTSVDYTVTSDDGSVTYTSGTHTLSLTSTSSVGVNLVSSSARCHDFKVYA